MHDREQAITTSPKHEGRVNCQTRVRAARAACMEKIYEIPRAGAVQGAMRWILTSQVNSTLRHAPCTRTFSRGVLALTKIFLHHADSVNLTSGPVWPAVCIREAWCMVHAAWHAGSGWCQIYCVLDNLDSTNICFEDF
jgi:hypothetical protein